MLQILYAIRTKNLPQDIDTIAEQVGYGWKGLVAQLVNQLLSAVTNEQVLHYLEESSAWEQTTSPKEGVVMFRHNVTKDVAAHIREDFDDYRWRLEELLDTLSKVEERPVEVIIAEMRDESVHSLLSSLFSHGEEADT